MTTTEPVSADTTTAVPAGWRGRLMPVNTISGDKRRMALEGDVAPVRPLPLAFKAQELSAEAHDNSRVVGLITRVWLEDGFVWGEGPFDLSDPFAAEWARKLGDGFAGWVSIDLSDGNAEEVPLDADGNRIPLEAFDAYSDALAAWETDPADAGPPPAAPDVADVIVEFTGWKVMGATLVADPAFEDARVAAVWEEFESTPAEPALVAAALADAEPAHTGAMIALVPADPDALTVNGGDPAEQLHLTLAYLGEAADWTPDAQAALHAAVAGLAGGGAVAGEVFGHATFGVGGPQEAAVYLLDAAGAAELRDAVWDVLATTPGLPGLPEQHQFIAHVTAGYGVDAAALSYTGPVAFDRIRVAFADQVTDTVLDTEALAASAGVTYRHDDFFVPEPEHYVNSWQVTPDGRVSMHLAAWDECHIGYAGRCTSPPRGVAAYNRFHRLAVDTDQGPVRVGKITMGTGHASQDPSMTAAAAMAHYDNTGTLVAVVRCTDGRLGPWLSGHLVPWASKTQAQQLAHHEVSGDWRGPMGGMELVAALAVNVPGFMKSVAASGAVALVAAGRPHTRPAAPAATPMTREDIRSEVRSVLTEFAVARDQAAALAPIDARVRAAKLARQERRVWGTA